MLKQNNELMIAAKWGEDITEAALRSKGASEGQSFVENRLKQQTDLMNRLTTVSEHEKDRAQQAQMHRETLAASNARFGVTAAGKPAANGMPPGYDRAEVDAWNSLLKGTVPPKGDKAAYAAAQQRIAEIAQKNGMTVQELISASADVKTKLAVSARLKSGRRRAWNAPGKSVELRAAGSGKRR